MSKRRAEAVTAVLESAYGVAARRFYAFCAAHLALVARNNGEEGREKNRRMELVPR